MLVLSRKLDQTIVIADNITIRILEISGDRVKIGITAPRDVVVLREELAVVPRTRDRVVYSSGDDHLSQGLSQGAVAWQSTESSSLPGPSSPAIPI